jgi:hypothetical protein
VIAIVALSGPQPDQHTLYLDLSVGHTRLRATQTAIRPDDRLGFQYLDLFGRDSKPVGKVILCLLN